VRCGSSGDVETKGVNDLGVFHGFIGRVDLHGSDRSSCFNGLVSAEPRRSLHLKPITAARLHVVSDLTDHVLTELA
jgi:hypothetical protein